MGCPEHEKLKAVQKESQAIGEFLEWLNGRAILAQWVSTDGEDYTVGVGRLHPIHKSTNAWLAEYFGIDSNKLEAEKRAMLDSLTAQRS